MNILVLNGSPSGENSITLYTVLYLEKQFPDCTFEVLQVGQRIRAMEKDFSACEKALKEADLILFCYPVYTFLVPSQLHRFIELIKEHQVDLAGKYATQISTSLHFYDITAHRFIRDNCADLGMRYLEGLSADMEDLLSEKGRKEAEAFFRFVLWNMKQGYRQTEEARNGAQEVQKAPAAGEIALVADLSGDDRGRLRAMIDCFQKNSRRKVRLIDLQEFPFAGGCLGCFHCASDGKCIYKDGFDEFLRTNIQKTDATVYAFTIKDHSMGYTFKLYDDRQFCNGHRTVTMGKPVGYLVNGALAEEENLRLLIEARAQVGGNYLAGAVDNAGPDTEEAVRKLAMTLEYAIENEYQPPKNFYGVGGLKIFRDLIYQMRGLMKEDHRFYKKHGFYDFPQKRKGRIVGMYLVGALMNNKKLSKKVGGKMTEGMIMPYKKALEKLDQ